MSQIKTSDSTLVKNFWSIPLNTLTHILQSSTNGLSQHIAEHLLKQNPLHEEKHSALIKDIKLFFRQFKNPLMLLLISAVVLASFLGEISDAIIILFIVLSSGILSFIQERGASRIIEKLQSLLALKCTVVRDGIAREVSTSLIVPGDVVFLKAGDMIPADCLLFESNELYLNESSLTGESFPVRKEVKLLPPETELAKRCNSLWQGSNVVSGTGKALVIHTREQTIFGEITKDSRKSIETSFEKNLNQFGFFLMKITLVLSIGILVTNLILHKGFINSALFALALAVGMAPELLPAITTIAMSAGAERLLRKKVIVKKLASIQNLGEVSLLCTDKTGTITSGVITVADFVNPKGQSNSWVQALALWNAKFESGYNNPIDLALKSLIPNNNKIFIDEPILLGEVPYDFIRKRISIIIKIKNYKILVTKGAFNEVAKICNSINLHNFLPDKLTSLDEITIQHENIASHLNDLNNTYIGYGNDGFRAMAVAYKVLPASDPNDLNTKNENVFKSLETEMTFAGFIKLNDPVKDGIVETIQELNKLKVDLKIITGDNQNIAKSIALKIGIPNPHIITGSELAKISTSALELRVTQAHIFAEIDPQQKERIIMALRKSYTVAYMGDGINDVSAINVADVGISVENAVDVAKEAADIVLLEKDLMVLIDGIKEGRKTFANTLKYIFVTTGATFGNMFSVAIASIILPFMPMLPFQILLTNFITDLPYLSIASDNVDEEQLLMPGKWDLKLVRNYMLVFGLHSSIFDVLTFAILFWGFKSIEITFQTGWFLESIITELFILFIIRTKKSFFKSRPTKTLLLLSLTGIIVTIILPYMPFAARIGLTPLSLSQVSVLALIIVLYVITADFLKINFFKYQAAHS